jgi:tRNA threonylcarbamoyladenosine biosynthesis protein TsaB
MKILAVDTALGACSVALLEDARLLAHIFEPMERGHAERLAPMVDEAMKQSGMDFAALDLLAVTIGPGTFTGQRVGLAFMRGLRLALRKPLTGVTTLEAMAAAAMTETGAPKAAAIHDARREEAYLLLRNEDVVELAPVVLPFAEAVARIAAFGPCALAGTGAAAAHEKLGRDFPLSAIRQPDALWVARLAQKLPPSDGAPGPLYLRAPDAKLPGGMSIGQASASEPSAVRPIKKPLFEIMRFDPAADSAPLAALHAACFDEAWDAQSLASMVTAPGAFAFHHADGFVLARVAAGEAEILTLAVAPHARGQGLGRALLEAAIGHAQQAGAGAMFLEVGSDNPAALALYAGLGFANVGLRKAYYRARNSSVDALVLRLLLPADLP